MREHCALFVVAIVAFQQLYDFSAWEEKLASELTSLSGYPISTAGEMGLRFKPRPVFVIPKLKVDNVAWAKEASTRRVRERSTKLERVGRPLIPNPQPP